jgi:hypothetical protein
MEILSMRKFWSIPRNVLAVNFSLIMSDVITEVLSSLLSGKAINELFTGRNELVNPVEFYPILRELKPETLATAQI